MWTKQTIARKYMEGVPVTEIADENNVTREAIYQKLRGMKAWKGMKTQHASHKASQRMRRLREHTDDIVSGWIAGVTMADLAIEFNTSRSNISDIIKDEMGSTRRNYKRDLKITEEYRNGATQTELSKKYGISQPCISRIVNTLYEDGE
jgi:predicted DNA-binding protein YlxM (UPF0122 family)